MSNTVQVLFVQCREKKLWLLFCISIHLIGFHKDNGMHAWIYICQQKGKDKTILSWEFVFWSARSRLVQRMPLDGPIPHHEPTGTSPCLVDVLSPSFSWSGSWMLAPPVRRMFSTTSLKCWSLALPPEDVEVCFEWWDPYQTARSLAIVTSVPLASALP